MTDFLVFGSIGYLLGSIPCGLLAGMVFGRIDVRKHGSGNTGMTNVLRTVNRPVAALVLAGDMSKAAIAVLIADILVSAPGVEVTAGIAAIVGHNWPIFLKFKGGRGTSTGWGALAALSPPAGLIATLFGAPTAAISKYMSLGSIVGTVTGSASIIFLALIGLEPIEYAWYGLLGTPLIIERHRGNVQRLISGKERKIGTPATSDVPSPETKRNRIQ